MFPSRSVLPPSRLKPASSIARDVSNALSMANTGSSDGVLAGMVVVVVVVVDVAVVVGGGVVVVGGAGLRRHKLLFVLKEYVVRFQ